MALSNFNAVAFCYDFLARLVFGTALQKAQKEHLYRLPETGSVLIVGGGTGWVLKEVLRVRPKLEVTYAEPSIKMTALARQKLTKPQASQVSFFTGGVEALQKEGFDAVLTFFVLDVFPAPEALQTVMQGIYQKLKPNGQWLVADFSAAGCQRGWRAALLWLMFRFFKLTAGLKNQRLDDFPPYFRQLGLATKNESFFFHGMVISFWAQRPRE